MLQGKTILLVEDNPINRELATDLLALAGAFIVPAEDAETALAIVGQHPVDIVLMDISLPRMDGLEATRQLKANPATAALPVVALTAHAMAGDAERVAAAGCAGYLTKPIDTRHFAREVARLLAAQPSGAT